MWEWVVLEEESGKKLQAFLFEKLNAKESLRSIKKLIEAHCCAVNGRVERFASTVVGRGDRISLRMRAAPKKEKPFCSAPLFEDEWFCVYNKPAGVSCDSELLGLLLPDAPSAWRLVHRLDKETSGALLIAKEERTLNLFISAFKEFRVKKRYVALVDGLLLERKGKIENFLVKKKSFDGQTLWGAATEKKTSGEALFASTDWERIAVQSQTKASLVACFPKTGRTHQLRVHLAGMGHPILGDFQYGRHFKCLVQPPRMLLHAEKLSFMHPLTQKPLDILAPLPEDFNEGLAACKFL